MVRKAAAAPAAVIEPDVVEGVESAEITEVAEDDKALVAAGNGFYVDIDRMQLGKHFEVNFIGMKIIGNPSLGVCGDMSKVLQIWHKSLQFSFGDFMNWAEGVFGEKAAQLIPDEMSWGEDTQRVYQWVASKVPVHLRRAELSFTHHQLVAKLSEPEQKVWLDKAVHGHDGVVWTVATMKKAMAGSARDVIFNAGEPKWEVVVTCTSNDDMVACCRQLDNLGRKYTAKDPKVKKAD